MAPTAAAAAAAADAPRRRRRDDPAAVARQLIDKEYDAICFDCDGVLWKGDALVTPRVPALLEQLRRRGVAYVFFTNNSLRSRADYAAKFAKLGLGAYVSADQIYSSSYAAAAFLRRQEQEAAAAAVNSGGENPRPPPAARPPRRAYVVGGQGIIDELRLAGFDAFGGPEDGDKRVDFAKEVVVEDNVFAVVVGVDPRLNYFKIHYAALCLLREPQGLCAFVACNEDGRGHFSPSQEWPGAGASVAAVAAVVGRPPDAVVGKPSTFLAGEVVRALRERRGGGKAGPRVLMVGDRLDTDVAWAHAAADEMMAAEGGNGGEGGGGGRRAMGALLVMSGVATDADLNAWPARAPEFVLGDVGELADALEAAAAADASR